MNKNKWFNVLFTQNKERWDKTKKKGKKAYLIDLGLIKFGFGIWFVRSGFIYVRNKNFDFLNLSLLEFFKDFMIFIPLYIFFGLIVSHYLWENNNRKFK